MPNMSYCAFENTVDELRQCKRLIEECSARDNEHERRAYTQFIALIKDIYAVVEEDETFPCEEEEDEEEE